ncbi:DNA polymerase IV [Actinomyces sp. B33]|uniref:DNA polymerase IV n=1 Tax=Actinomyces sp. B33 TaxID=2942131 RepID=UPI002340C2CD|nr:DNA polymerase IV [Actinomyces sp. B33]MDC4233072.1 DNA polymerase IV [Actinomyces sp. B33]
MSNAPRDARTRRHWGDDDSQTPILHVDMDSFFAQVEMQEDPSLVGRPLVVAGLGNRGVVTSATYEARALGVRAGMPTARARALCPGARFVQGSRGVYSRYSRRVMGILSEITPVVEQVSIDEAFLDVSGARRRLGSPTAIARELRARIREEVGLPASVGIASTKSVAKIASSNAKPDGLLLIPRDQTTAFLHGLPVGALWGVGGRTGAVLEREGLTTIGDLAHARVDRLARLLGPAAAHHLHDLAWGIDPRPVRAGREEKSVGTERTFDRDVRSRDQIGQYILAASHECAHRLRAADVVGWTVSIKMRDPSFQTVTRSMTLPVPTDLGRDIAAAAGELFSREAMPVGGVRLFGVRVEGLQSRAQGVPVVLDTDERPEQAERAMDRIRDRFGPGAITPASLLAPEQESSVGDVEH